jgi:uncharacterized protein (TIGR02147 family)
MENTNKIEITQYTDYILFINDWVAAKKQAGDFSFRSFSKNSGFKSPSYLKLVMNGTRAISPKSIHKFALGLGLNKNQSQYFELLVNYKTANDERSKRIYLEQILALQKNKSGNEKEEYEFLSKWYHVAIRELIAHPDCNSDVQWLRRVLVSDLSLWEIKAALKTLLKLGLLKEENDKFTQSSADLHTDKEVQNIAAYNYHSEVLTLSQNILATTPSDQREVSSTVSLVTKETFLKLKTKMREFQNEIVQELSNASNLVQEHTDTNEELYMLNMQLLPFTKINGE